MRAVPSFLKHSAVAGMAIVMAGALTTATLVATATPSLAATCNGYVALTFDDGPNGNTNSLLNALKAAKVRATLFNIGQNAKNNAALVKAEKDAGMWIGNHSWSHQHMAQLGAQQMSSDLSQAQQAIQQASGTAPTIFRPPYGETNGTLQSAASALGLRTVTWDVDSRDWAGAGTAAIVQAGSQLQAGQIILMHDQYQTTIQAIPQIVSNLTSRNLCAGMISRTTGRAVAPDAG